HLASIASLAPCGVSCSQILSHLYNPVVEIIHTKVFCAPAPLISGSLEDIYRKALGRFETADNAHQLLEREYDKTKKSELLPKLFAAMQESQESGVALLWAASSLLDYCLYKYAVTKIHPKAWDDHLDNIRTVSKWIVIPQICQGKHIPEDCPAINGLKELVKARNCVVHPRVKLIAADGFPDTNKEGVRFKSACRNVEATVTALLDLLKKTVTPASSQSAHPESPAPSAGG
ncbi:MAG: hypothetical protein NT105_16610, partial [Verrucomicrobia bacterium]|nr:hypothetical protein [Verrucomicrobiota bacterium]